MTIGGETKYTCGCGLSSTQPFCNGTHKIARKEDPNTLYWYDETGTRFKPLTVFREFAVHNRHALSHVGFAGATGSVLLGTGPLWGLLVFTLVAAIAMGLLGERLRGRDVAVGIILSLSLGLGVLFLYLYTTHATHATTILFGNVLGVDLEGQRGPA